jgi:hypothetical protein
MVVRQCKNPRACLFCGDTLTGVRSQEHVFPQWILDELKIRGKQVSAVHVFRAPDPDSEPEVLSSRALAIENIREGRICAGCNNGWMSDLEHSCREILLALAHGQRQPGQLSEAECLPVARWMAKTAYVLNSSANYTIKVPAQHLRELHENARKLPWGVVVIATIGPFVNSGWFQSTRWQLCAPDNLTNRIAGLMDTRTYKIGIQLGHMLLLVVWHAIPGWWKMLWHGQHTVLWPWRGKCGWHYDDDSILRRLGPDMILPVQVNEIKLVHPRYLMKPK